MQMFIAALFIIVPNRELLKYPSAGEWINGGTSIGTTECHSVIKSNWALITYE